MMTNEHEIKETELYIKQIKDRYAHFKSCQDGSYQMALDSAGYYKLVDRLDELKGGAEIEKELKLLLTPKVLFDLYDDEAKSGAE
jgi:hypothetical protein